MALIFTTSLGFNGFPLSVRGEWLGSSQGNPKYQAPRLTPTQMTKLFEWLDSPQTIKDRTSRHIRPVFLTSPPHVLDNTFSSLPGIMTDRIALNGLRYDLTSSWTSLSNAIAADGVAIGGSVYPMDGMLLSQDKFIPLLTTTQFNKLLEYLNDESRWVGQRHDITGGNLPSRGPGGGGEGAGSSWSDWGGGNWGGTQSKFSYPSKNGEMNVEAWIWSPSYLPSCSRYMIEEVKIFLDTSAPYDVGTTLVRLRLGVGMYDTRYISSNAVDLLEGGYTSYSSEVTLKNVERSFYFDEETVFHAGDRVYASLVTSGGDWSTQIDIPLQVYSGSLIDSNTQACVEPGGFKPNICVYAQLRYRCDFGNSYSDHDEWSSSPPHSLEPPGSSLGDEYWWQDLGEDSHSYNGTHEQISKRIYWWHWELSFSLLTTLTVKCAIKSVTVYLDSTLASDLPAKSVYLGLWIVPISGGSTEGTPVFLATSTNTQSITASIVTFQFNPSEATFIRKDSYFRLRCCPVTSRGATSFPSSFSIELPAVYNRDSTNGGVVYDTSKEKVSAVVKGQIAYHYWQLRMSTPDDRLHPPSSEESLGGGGSAGEADPTTPDRGENLTCYSVLAMNDSSIGEDTHCYYYHNSISISYEEIKRIPDWEHVYLTKLRFNLCGSGWLQDYTDVSCGFFMYASYEASSEFATEGKQRKGYFCMGYSTPLENPYLNEYEAEFIFSHSKFYFTMDPCPIPSVSSQNKYPYISNLEPIRYIFHFWTGELKETCDYWSALDNTSAYCDWVPLSVVLCVSDRWA